MVALHPLAAALVPLDDVEDVQDAIFVVGRMRHVVPGAALLFQPARVDLHRLTAITSDLHAGFLVDVLVLEIEAAHLDEQRRVGYFTCRRSTVFRRRAAGVDLGDADDLGAIALSGPVGVYSSSASRPDRPLSAPSP